MRKDIEIHINTGDVTVTRQNTFKLRDFSWTTNPGGLSRYIYGEVTLPYSLSENKVRQDGFYFKIPYTPKYKEVMLRIGRVYEDGSVKYVLNQTDGSEWYTLRCGLWGSDMQNAYASMLKEISEEAYYGKINGAYIDLYGCAQSDFNIVNADRQNANCLLACSPGNNYRYPLSGVGLRRWVNSNNVNSGGLAETLQQEFNDDGVEVVTANYHYDTQQMELELDSSNAV